MHHPLHPLLFPLLLPFLLLSLLVADGVYYKYANCTPIPYTCGSVSFNLSYPFFIDGVFPNFCGHAGYGLSCRNLSSTSSSLTVNGSTFPVKKIDTINGVMTLVDTKLASAPCPFPSTIEPFDPTLFRYTPQDVNLSVHVNCTSSEIPFREVSFCPKSPSYYAVDADLAAIEVNCESSLAVPLDKTVNDLLMNGSSSLSFSDAVSAGFMVQWTAGEGWCAGCMNSGGRCGYNFSFPTEHTCFCPDGPALDNCTSAASIGDKSIDAGMISGVVVGALIAIAAAAGMWVFFYRRRKQQKGQGSSTLLKPPSFRSKPGLSSHDLESGDSAHSLQTHIFTYEELAEATDSFDSARQLGDGGFGTVYKGKLRDGRVVAVKMLYKTYRQVEQFVNEAAILSRLRHPHLVAFYGCTSSRSRDLLLVYEFVANGTVANHLHGHRARERVLTWPHRLTVAVEAAEALAYLHAVEPPIIHRDIKTENILLDADFHVKVADFGLSRLFPVAATHVSTAPQGTPGYVDPEYYQSYQLTDKSDVYSFGVVLAELISSQPAVDITRSRTDINLASMAISKIQSNELDQLMDLQLGFATDPRTRAMMVSVAELAFRCLQCDGEMRPSMREVHESLRSIKREGFGEESDEGDDARLLKKVCGAMSPDTVTANWSSMATTPNTSQ